MVSRGFGFEFVEDGLGHGRREFLRREPEAPADNNRVTIAREQPERFGLGQRGHNVLVKRLANRTRLFGAVEHGDGFDGLGQRGGEMLERPRAEKAHYEDAGFLAVGVEPRGALGGGLGAGAHDDDHALGVRVALVVEKVVAAAGESGKFLEQILHRPGNRRVERVAAFAGLKKRVRVLRRAPEHRGVGGERPRAECRYVLVADQRAEDVLADQVDFAHLVRGAETVEEMHERHARAQRGRVGNGRHVLRFLHGGGRQHGHTDLAAGHHVRVVAENGQRVRGERACGDVKHERMQFAGDFVEVGDHQEQPLRRRKTARHRARLKHPVQRARRAALALHLDHAGHRAPHVFPTLGRPLVAKLSHRRGWCDRVNREGFCQRICHRRGGLVCINCRLTVAWIHRIGQ